MGTREGRETEPTEVVPIGGANGQEETTEDQVGVKRGPLWLSRAQEY